MRIILYLLVVALLLVVIFGGQKAVSYTQVEEPKNQYLYLEVGMFEDPVKKYAHEVALKYNVPFSTLDKIIKCESSWQVDVQSNHYRNGIREDSWGLVQINLPSHPNITKEQAIDPYFALDFLAKNVSLGKERMWTCAR